jgi:hypothetical protein
MKISSPETGAVRQIADLPLLARSVGHGSRRSSGSHSILRRSQPGVAARGTLAPFGLCFVLFGPSDTFKITGRLASTGLPMCLQP